MCLSRKDGRLGTVHHEKTECGEELTLSFDWNRHLRYNVETVSSDGCTSHGGDSNRQRREINYRCIVSRHNLISQSQASGPGGILAV